MPKGFIKIISILMGAIGLTGCLSQMVSPLTFGPLLVLEGVIYANEGIVGQGVLTGWQILTWITYVQLVTAVLQFGAFYLLSELDKWEKGKKLSLQAYPLQVVLPSAVAVLLLHLLLVYGITWLHFPAVRGVTVYPGVRLQAILAGGSCLLGLYMWGAMIVSPNGRSRCRRSYLPGAGFWQKRFGQRPQKRPPRGRTQDGTILPKPTQQPRRDPPQRPPSLGRWVENGEEPGGGVES